MKRILLFVTMLALALTSNAWSAPLHDAAASGDSAEVAKLLESGADLKATTENGDTPLHYAVVGGNAEVVKLLLDKGADVNAKENSGVTALILAAENGSADICAVLISRGADVNAKTGLFPDRPSMGSKATGLTTATVKETIIEQKREDKKAFWNSALALAASIAVSAWSMANPVSGGHSFIFLPRNLDFPKPLATPSMVNNKLTGAAKYHATDRTPLHYAAAVGSADIVKLLVENGADIRAKDEDKATPLRLALDARQYQAASQLIRNGAGPLSLSETVLVGSADDVRRLLELGINVNAVDTAGLTPLHYAALSGRDEIIPDLLANGAKIDALSTVGSITPLFLAAAGGQTETVGLLLEKGANLKVKGASSLTPLHGAAMTGHTKTVGFLIEKGADINAKARGKDSAEVCLQLMGIADSDTMMDNRTPLHWAARNGKADTVKFLLEKGADPNANSDRKGITDTKRSRRPLHDAAAGGDFESAKALLDAGAKADCKDFDGVTPLTDAALNGAYSVVTLLLDKNVDPNMKPGEKTGNIPLVAAVIGDNTETVRLLLSRGADANGRGSVIVPLTLATISGNVDIVKLLLDNGAEINVRQRKNITVSNTSESINNAVAQPTTSIEEEKGDNVNSDISVMMAIEHNKTEAAQLLIERGAKVNWGKALPIAIKNDNLTLVKLFLQKNTSLSEPDSDGKTLLHIAAMNGSIEVARYLLEKGDNPSAKDKKGSTPAQLAEENGMVQTARLLLEKDPASLTIQGAALLGRMDDLQRLLGDRSVKSSDGDSLLFLATIGGSTETVKLLLSRGARTNARDGAGLTPLHIAALEGQTDVAKVLIDSSVNVDAMDYVRATPLIWAAGTGNTGIVRLLLEKGAKTDLKALDGSTAISAAESNKHPEVVLMLTRYKANRANEQPSHKGL